MFNNYQVTITLTDEEKEAIRMIGDIGHVDWYLTNRNNTYNIQRTLFRKGMLYIGEYVALTQTGKAIYVQMLQENQG